MLRYFTVVSIVLLASGCAILGPKSINPGEFQRVSIPMNANPPTEAQLAGDRVKVVVFKTENKAELAKRLNIGEASTGAIEGYIAESAELIDRTVASKLKDEIMLVEVKGAGSWDGPSVADYAVMSDLTLAKSSSKFHEAYTYKNKKGETRHVGPRCSYSADVAGNLKVYKLPSLTLVDGIKISGGKTESEDVRANYWFSRSSRCNNSDERTSGLLQKAASNAIDRERTTLQNHFAPKGYITERRGGKGGDIFKISLGSINGADKGLSVEIHREEMVVNPLTKKSESEVIPLGVAEITDQVEDHYSWVFIGDKEDANKLMLGDTVTILFKTSLFEKVANFTKQ